MLKAQESRFKGPAIFSQTVYTHSGEGDLAAALTQIAQKYSKVDIGSYPNTKAEDDSYVTKLVLHSRDPKIIEEATEDITSLIPKCWQ
jgi:molybdopterin-biosynthesis enzyme MoeA-like protein